MMKTIVAFLLLLLTTSVFANSEIEIQNALIKFSPPGADVTAVFCKIINHSNSDLKIQKVVGDFSPNFELHTMAMVKGKMQMRPVEFISVKKKSHIELKSGGFHIMVFNFTSPLKMGETHKLKFILEDKKEIEFVAKVE